MQLTKLLAQHNWTKEKALWPTVQSQYIDNGSIKKKINDAILMFIS